MQEEPTIRKVDKPTSVLISIDPVADFKEGRLEESDIKYIAGDSIDFDPVARGIQFHQRDIKPACQTQKRFPECNRYTGADHSKDGHDIADARAEETDDECQCKNSEDSADQPVDVVETCRFGDEILGYARGDATEYERTQQDGCYNQTCIYELVLEIDTIKHKWLLIRDVSDNYFGREGKLCDLLGLNFGESAL